MDQLPTATYISIDEYMDVSHGSKWSFMHGFIFGQLTVVIVLAFFLKFFVFSESFKPLSNSPPRINNKKKSDEFRSLDSDVSVTTAQAILEKTYYNVDSHVPESLDWFNVLVAQTISQFREEALTNDNIYHSLNELLCKSEMPDYLDEIKITEINIGNDFPIFSNCRVKHSPDHSGRLEAKIDVDVADTLTFGIDTRLLLNHPKPFTAVLPVSLSVSIVRFSGCLTVSLVTTMEDTKECEEDKEGKLSGAALMFSFSPDYRLEFEIKSLIGARSKLQDVPRIGNLLETKLRNWFAERCIEPRFQLIRLPSLWPRKKNTREPVVNQKGEEELNAV